MDDSWHSFVNIAVQSQFAVVHDFHSTDFLQIMNDRSDTEEWKRRMSEWINIWDEKSFTWMIELGGRESDWQGVYRWYSYLKIRAGVICYAEFLDVNTDQSEREFRLCWWLKARIGFRLVLFFVSPSPFLSPTSSFIDRKTNVDLCWIESKD